MFVKKENREKNIEIVNRIKEGAKIYRDELAGKTFLIIFEGQSIEVMFKKENFLHFTGVETNLYAEDFYKKALIEGKGGLKYTEIGFSVFKPYHFADIKTSHLKEAFTLFQRDTLIITDLHTNSTDYKFGSTDFELVFGFNDRLNDEGIKINDFLVPQTLRIEELANNQYQEMFSVDYILSRKNDQNEYDEIVFGEKEELFAYLDEHEEIQLKHHISNDLRMEKEDYER